MTRANDGSAGRLWYLGLGSNLGDRERMLRSALRLLDARPEVRLIKTSRIYETEPWGHTDQPPFLNQVALVWSSLAPLALLAATKRIEAELGRRPTHRWGPRAIDIDLLLCEGLQLDTPGLKVPHPLLAARQFVLVPLAELDPTLILPDGRRVSGHLSDDKSVRLWSGKQPAFPPESGG